MDLVIAGVVLIVVFLIYWILIKDGQFKIGIGKFSKHQYSDAIQNFNKAILKNPNHSKAYFYLGMCYKFLAEQNEIDSFKKTAIQNFIRSSNCIPYNGKANNLVELMICSEKDLKIKKEILFFAKKELVMSEASLKDRYQWLYLIEEN